jgi:hypothetical protein
MGRKLLAGEQMSLLGTQVYANSDTPIWLSAKGGTIDGNLTVTGTADFQSNIQVASDIDLQGNLVLQGSSNSALLTTDAGGDSLYLVASNSINFGRDSTTPNTTLTLSAPGAGLDNFTTNFLYAIGPVPTNLINTPRTINPVPTSPAEPFLVDTPFPVVSGQVYDVQATGLITLISGTPDPDDAVLIQLDAGTGTSVSFYTYYPSGPGQSGSWAIRQRIVGNATQPSLAVAVQKTLAGTSTAVYAATLGYFSAVRVA